MLVCCRKSDAQYSYIRINDPSFGGKRIDAAAETIIDGAPLMVAVGNNGGWTSSDGRTCVRHAGPTLRKVWAGYHMFYALSLNGLICESSNGREWTSREPTSAGTVNDILRIDGGYLAVGYSINSGDNGDWPAVWISDDFETWERHFLDFSFNQANAAAR